MAIFTNQATLRVGDTVTASNITVGELVEALTVTKTAVTDTYTVGGTVSYVINLVNTGTATLDGLTVTDDLGAYTAGTETVYPLTVDAADVRYFVNGVPAAAPAVTAGPPLVVSGISVPAGGSAAVVYQARVTAFAPPTEGGTVTNAATVTGDALTAPVTATETVTAVAARHGHLHPDGAEYGQRSRHGRRRRRAFRPVRSHPARPRRDLQRHAVGRGRKLHLRRRHGAVLHPAGTDHRTCRHLHPGSRYGRMDHRARHGRPDRQRYRVTQKQRMLCGIRCFFYRFRYAYACSREENITTRLSGYSPSSAAIFGR